MRYLLDTHALIWYFEDYTKLPAKIETLIDNPEVEIFVSAVSLWEIAIKISIGKLNISYANFHTKLKESGFGLLEMESNSFPTLLELPLIHRDPFDRLIIAASMAQNLIIITSDENIQKYDIQWVW